VFRQHGAGLSTRTTDNGSYEFAGVAPGAIAIRASKAGYTSADTSAQLHAGDNRLSVLIEELPNVHVRCAGVKRTA
jgi:hypothetical protein